MKPWIRRSLAGVLGLAVFGAAGLALGAWLGDRKAQRHIEVAVQAVAIPQDSFSMERGRYLYASRGCIECHGANGAGRTFIDDGSLMVHAPNISSGPNSLVNAYTATDWVRTLRHGIKPDGRPLFVMPSEDYNRLTDTDLGALVAYVRQLPPAEGPGFSARVPALVKALYGVGLIQDAAEKIDHRLPPTPELLADGSELHGAYVANTCIGCHGARLSGGRIPGSPPSWPAAANLTPGDGSAMVHYADAEQFIAMLRSGRRPDGSEVSPVMPFASLRELNEADALALYAHLKRLPPVAAGQR
ncbi:c-type cytochrome [Hydrogenophaga sp.]|uniref:c-type cytochrome n=1 Tax=Hydrogenophaga sp. TaxID=1904254 RepID=UPI003566BAEF